MQRMQVEPLATTQESRAPSAGFAPLSGMARYTLVPLALSGAGIALYLFWLWLAHMRLARRLRTRFGLRGSAQ